MTFKPFSLVLLLSLTACSIFPDVPPVPIYTLSAPTVESNGDKSIARSIVVDIPQSNAFYNTQRIAVSFPGFKKDYYANGQWGDQLPDLLQQVLVQTLEDSGSFKSISRAGQGMAADIIMQSEVREFSATYDKPEAPRVVISLHVKLVDAKEGHVVASQTFTREGEPLKNTLESVVGGFNAENQSLVTEVLEWVVESVR